MQNIVADMRKVLSKNPQVEQQKLHRRVFLENVNPENQALMVSVCSVHCLYFISNIWQKSLPFILQIYCLKNHGSFVCLYIYLFIFPCQLFLTISCVLSRFTIILLRVLLIARY